MSASPPPSPRQVTFSSTCSVNMPDPVQKLFGYGQHAAKIGSDPTSHIWFDLFFQIRPGSYCAKPAQIWSGWPGQVFSKHIWSRSKLVCKNHWARFWQNATSLLTSFPLWDSVAFFHRWPRWYCAEPAQIQFGSGSWWWFNCWNWYNCARFWPNGSSPEAISRCTRITGSASGQHYRAGPDWMWIWSSIFTGWLPLATGVKSGVVRMGLSVRDPSSDSRWTCLSPQAVSNGAAALAGEGRGARAATHAGAAGSASAARRLPAVGGAPACHRQAPNPAPASASTTLCCSACCRWVWLFIGCVVEGLCGWGDS